MSDWSSDVCSSDLVTSTLSEGEAEKAFLLSDRFALRPMDLPPGVTMSVEPSTSPMPALNKYSFRFSALSADPVKLRFRYAGPIRTEHDSGNKPLRPEGYELFIRSDRRRVGKECSSTGRARLCR